MTASQPEDPVDVEGGEAETRAAPAETASMAAGSVNQHMAGSDERNEQPASTLPGSIPRRCREMLSPSEVRRRMEVRGVMMARSGRTPTAGGAGGIVGSHKQDPTQNRCPLNGGGRPYTGRRGVGAGPGQAQKLRRCNRSARPAKPGQYEGRRPPGRAMVMAKRRCGTLGGASLAKMWLLMLVQGGGREVRTGAAVSQLQRTKNVRHRFPGGASIRGIAH